MFGLHNHNLTTVFKAKIQFYDENNQTVGAPQSVQINPSEISISRGYRYKAEKGIGEGILSYQTKNEGIGTQIISMTLYFDLVEAYDSLMNSIATGLGTVQSLIPGLNSSPEEQGEDFADKVKRKLLSPKAFNELTLIDEDCKFTCYKRLETAAINQEKIKFMWGAQTYEGKIENFSSTFTYFSSRGEPLRATVQLSIYPEAKQN